MSGNDSMTDEVPALPAEVTESAILAARRLLSAMEAEPIPDHLRRLAEELADALLRAGVR